LIIGFRDDGRPDTPPPTDVRSKFHLDVIQPIVSRFASQSFSIAVEFVKREGVEYPVICVPIGVETPVAAKSDLPNPDSSKRPLVVCNAVYIRTVESNGTISSSAARWKDWPQIVRNCFDNREADIGAFVRRHLSNIELGPLSGLLAVKPPKKPSLNVPSISRRRARFDSMRRGKMNGFPCRPWEHSRSPS